MIIIKNLSLRLGNFSLKDINLTMNDREYFVILGPTGAGKTVLIECLAGLHHIKQGEIWIEQHNVTHLTPEERNTGYVPQDYVLFPFLNVAENIAFGLRQKPSPKSGVPERVKALSSLLGISHLLKRDVRSLSGGEAAGGPRPRPGTLPQDTDPGRAVEQPGPANRQAPQTGATADS